LTVIEYIDVPVKEMLRDAAYLQLIYSLRPDLKDILGGKLGTIGQVCVCSSTLDENRVIIFSNTHLFYHPAAGYVRVLQTDAILRVVADVRAALQADCASFVTDGCDRQQDALYHVRAKYAAISKRGLSSRELGEQTGSSNPVLDDSSGRSDRSDHPGLVPDGSVVSSASRLPRRISTVFMGDLNSPTETAVIEYLER
jgi:hypothetical protein